jgi:hypothetical protein
MLKRNDLPSRLFFCQHIWQLFLRLLFYIVMKIYFWNLYKLYCPKIGLQNIIFANDKTNENNDIVTKQ